MWQDGFTMNPANELGELCERLQRDASARGVMVLNEEGEIIGHAGPIGACPNERSTRWPI